MMAIVAWSVVPLPKVTDGKQHMKLLVAVRPDAAMVGWVQALEAFSSAKRQLLVYRRDAQHRRVVAGSFELAVVQTWDADEATKAWSQIVAASPKTFVKEVDDDPAKKMKRFETLNEYEAVLDVRKRYTARLQRKAHAGFLLAADKVEAAANGPATEAERGLQKTLETLARQARNADAQRDRTATACTPPPRTAADLIASIMDSPSAMRAFGLTLDARVSIAAIAGARGLRLDPASLSVTGNAFQHKCFETEVEWHGGIYHATTFDRDQRNELYKAAYKDAHGSYPPNDHAQKFFGWVEEWSPRPPADDATRSITCTDGITTTEVAADVLRDAITESEDRPPPGETAGISIAKRGVSHFLMYNGYRQRRLEAFLNGEAGGDVWAERLEITDLMRGYRPLVACRGPVIGTSGERYKWGNWSGFRSLTANRASVKIGTASASGEEDGCVELAVVKQEDGKQGLASEILFTWRNWPLLVPRAFEASWDYGEKCPPGNVTRGLSQDHSRKIPPLRFGCEYAFALQAVSITGDAFGELPTEPSGDDDRRYIRVLFARSEPVLPPEVVMDSQRKVKVGEPHDALTKHGEGPLEIVLRPGFVGKSPRWRWLIPPACSAEFGEMAGLLDRVDGSGFRADAAELLERSDPHEGQTRDLVFDPRLADPAAEGVILEGADIGDPAKQLSIRYGPSHVRGKPVLIELVDAHKGKYVEAREVGSYHHVKVFVPEGEELRVSVRSLVPERRANELLPLVRLLDSVRTDNVQLVPAALANAKAMALKQAATWAAEVTRPKIELSLSRPVASPILAPKLVPKAVARRLNETAARIPIHALIHRGSTEKIRVLARWEEYMDSETKLTSVTSDVFLGEIDVVTRTRGMPATPTLEGYALADNVWPTVAPDFTDGRHRRLNVTLVAAPPKRFVTALGKKAKAESRSSEPTLVSIPNSVRPAPIEIDAIVPITRTRGKHKKRRQHWGLRVYMKPGFYHSGPGEKVAILEAVPNEPGSSRKLVTQLASDPLALPTSQSPSFAIRNGRVVQNPFEIPEEDFRLALVRWLTPRRSGARWYVDVDFAMKDLYFPFVQLVLARYQPTSVDGAHLSQPTVADFIQLPPDRNVTVWRRGNKISLAVTGTTRPVNKMFSTIYRRLQGSMDRTDAEPDPNLMLDDDGLWVPYETRGPATRELARTEDSPGYWKLPDGVWIQTPRKPPVARAPEPWWKIVLEERERHLVGERWVERVVWLGEVDSRKLRSQ